MKSEQITKSQLMSTAQKDDYVTSLSDTSLFCEDLFQPTKMLDIFNVFDQDQNQSAEEKNWNSIIYDHKTISSPNVSVQYLKKKKIKKDKKIKGFNVEKKEQKQGCKCQNSNCLRLHCSCFKTLGYCSDSCRCLGCKNTKQYEDARQFVIDKTSFIYKKAFKSKVVQIESVGLINVEGCNCTKNCSTQYCGCKKVGTKCSPICRCDSCANNKILLTREQIKKVYKPCSRKKHKLVFDFNQKNFPIKQQKQSQKIIFKQYRKKQSKL